jgi:hypothetical protein
MPRGSLTALAGVEARRLLTHPLTLAGLALSVVAITVGARADEGQLQSFLLAGVIVLPLALGTFAAANLAALRSRRAGAEELLDTLPLGAGTRTGAQLLALLAVVPPALGVLAGAYLVFGAGEGLVVTFEGGRRTPALVELFQGPLLIVTLGAVGVLLGRVAPVALLASLLVVVVLFAEVPLASWAPDTAWRWAVPLVNDNIGVPDTWHPCTPTSDMMCNTVDRFDTTAMAWHLVALAGIAAAAAAAALTTRRGARAGLMLAAPALLAVTVVVSA